MENNSDIKINVNVKCLHEVLLEDKTVHWFLNSTITIFWERSMTSINTSSSTTETDRKKHYNSNCLRLRISLYRTELATLTVLPSTKEAVVVTSSLRLYKYHNFKYLFNNKAF